MTDYLKKYKSLFSTTLASGIGTGTGDTLTLSSVTGLPTDTPITITVDRVDSEGNTTPTKLERITGTISGGNLTSYTRGVDGTTEQAHSAGAVVEMIFNAEDWNDVVDWGLVEHDQDGTHKSTLVTTLKATGAEVNTGTEDAKIVTPKAIADSTIAKVKATADEVATGTDDVKYTTPLAVAPYANSSMARQAIINGNFDVWQRGTTSSLVDVTATFVADRWRDYHKDDGGTLPTITRSRQAQTAGALYNSFYFSRLATNGAGTSLGNASIAIYTQKIEHGVRFLAGDGKKVTVSFWAKSDIANKKIGIYLEQNYGSGGTPTAQERIDGTNWTLTSSWVKYTHTFTTNTLSGKTFGTANDDHLLLHLVYMWGSTNQSYVGAAGAETYVGSGNIDIAQVQLCAGDVALPFMPKSYGDELRACQRYYYRITADAIYSRFGFGTAVTTGEINFSVPAKVPLRAFPVISYSDLAKLQASDGAVATTGLSTLTINTATYSKDQIHCKVTKTGAFTQFRPYYVESNNSTAEWIAFEAEL